MAVEPAERGQAPAAPRARPSGADAAAGGPAATAASGSRSQRSASRGRAPALGGVGREAPQLDAVAAVAGRRAPASRAAARSGARAPGTSMWPPRENGCAAKPTPPGLAHRLGDLARRPPGVGDLPVDAEGEVVALLRADLGPDEHERRRRAGPPNRRGAPPASRDRSAAPPSAPALRAAASDLVDRRRAVRVRRCARGPRTRHRTRAPSQTGRGYPRVDAVCRLLAALGRRVAGGRRGDRPAPPLARASCASSSRGAGVAAPLAALVAWVLLTPALFPGTVLAAAGGLAFGALGGAVLALGGAVLGGLAAFTLARTAAGGLASAARAAQSQARARPRAARAPRASPPSSPPA